MVLDLHLIYKTVRIITLLFESKYLLPRDFSQELVCT